MKIYFHPCLDNFTNSYLVINDKPDVMEAILVDPGKITKQLIQHIEDGGYHLVAVLVTHNHTHHIRGIGTLMKIYTPEIFAADPMIGGYKSTILNGDGLTQIAGLNVEYLSVPGHSPDSIVYKIENIIFTGDTLLAGETGRTASKYSERLLSNKIHEKILSFPNETIIMPGHGSPSTIESEKQFNFMI